jgi:DNA mismatch repair ATPase MutS
VPKSVNERAREVLTWLEAQHQTAETTSQLAHRPSSNGVGAHSAQWQLTLFGVEPHPLLDEIRAANLDELRPVEALALVHEWQQRLKMENATAKR